MPRSWSCIRVRTIGFLFCSGSVLCGSLSACGDLVGNPELPAGTEDPSAYNTPDGARQQTAAATLMLQRELAAYARVSGLLTDELTKLPSTTENAMDVRELPEGGTGPLVSPANIDYTFLQKLRGQVRQARGLVAHYAPDMSPAVQGQLLAYEAYADILLADLFCSGVPLSTLDFEKDFTYRAGSPTAEIYQQAITLLDSALPLVVDSADLQTFVRVSKGRALLAMGQYEQAAAAVAEVPDGATYAMNVSFGTTLTDLTVADGEGQNGLYYITSSDPRTASHRLTFLIGSLRVTTNYPDKYRGRSIVNDTISNNAALQDSVSFVLASAIEARLIQAEAALQRGDITAWLQILNTLRTTGTYTGIDTTFQIDTTGTDAGTEIDTSIVRIDTMWVAGTGGVAGLGPLSDPGAAAARVDTMFAERAAWLFVTGHREGDLRRMIRQYDRDQSTVYPTGTYNSGSSTTGLYGNDVNAPIPPDERINPLFHGCLNRDA
jgi:hypothetical protein